MSEFNELRQLGQAFDVIRNSALFDRYALSKLASGGTTRDVDKECGYPAVSATISADDYQNAYERDGISARVNDLWPDECWQTQPDIYEDEDPTVETDFELAWNALNDDASESCVYALLNLHLLDRLCGIGDCGILLIGLGDGRDMREPADGLDAKTGRRSKSSPSGKQLLYLNCVPRKYFSITEKDSDPSSPRFGLPTMYNVSFDNGIDSASMGLTKTVHWTRVIHAADNCLVGRAFGEPRMKRGWNRLLDVKKLLGGSAEMFWQGAFPGIGLSPQPGSVWTAESKTAAKEELTSFMNGLQRWLAIDGVDPKPFATSGVADPSGHIRGQLQALCAQYGVPYRVFMGTEEGQLAGSQDDKRWNARVMSRCERFVSSRIVRPFARRLVALGVLPEPQAMAVEWPDRNAMTESEKADVAVKKTEAMSKYVAGGISQILAPKDWWVYAMGATEEEAESFDESAAKIEAEQEPEEEAVEEEHVEEDVGEEEDELEDEDNGENDAEEESKQP